MGEEVIQEGKCCSKTGTTQICLNYSLKMTQRQCHKEEETQETQFLGNVVLQLGDMMSPSSSIQSTVYVILKVGKNRDV